MILNKYPFEWTEGINREYTTDLPSVHIPIAGKRYGLLYSIYVWRVGHKFGSYRKPDRQFLFALEYMLFNKNNKPFHKMGKQIFLEDVNGFKEKTIFKKPKGLQDNFSYTRIYDL